MSDEKNRLGEIIKSARGDMSLREFAQKCQISHTHLDSLEKGYDPRTGKKVSIKLETLKKLSTALNCSVNYLMGETENPREGIIYKSDGSTVDTQSYPIGKILKALRENKNLSKTEVSTKTGIELRDLIEYENDIKYPGSDHLNLLSQIYDVTSDYILSFKPSVKSKGIKIPVLGKVQAGAPVEAVEEVIDYEEIPLNMAAAGEYFGLKIRGSSMEPRFIEGDVVIVRKQSDVESGDIAVVFVNGADATVKRVVKHQDGISLVALNPMFPPKFYTAREVIELPVVICGLVVELRGKSFK